MPARFDRHSESLWTIWRRRSISISLLMMLATVWLATAPLLLLVSVVVDTASGAGRRAPRARVVLFFGLYLFGELVGLLLAAGLWLVTAGGYAVSPLRWHRWNAGLQRRFTDAMFWGAVRIFHMRVEREIDTPSGPHLVFVRHSSSADTVLTAALVANPAGVTLRYVLKHELLWDPCLDVVGRRLRNAFIDRSDRTDSVARITELVQDLSPNEGVLIYPEGTRFTPGKLARGQARIREQRPALAPLTAGLRHVLVPRTAGPIALMKAAPGCPILMVEHCGLDGVETFADFWTGRLVGRTIRVRTRLIDNPAQHGATEDELARWLMRRWAEMDEWLDQRGGICPGRTSGAPIGSPSDGVFRAGLRGPT